MKTNKPLKKWKVLIIDDDRERPFNFAKYIENKLGGGVKEKSQQGERVSLEGRFLNYTVIHNITDAACEIWNTRYYPYAVVLNDMELPLIPGSLNNPLKEANINGIQISAIGTNLIQRIINEENIEANKKIILGGMWVALWANSIEYPSPFLNYSTAAAVLTLEEMKPFKAIEESDFHLTTYTEIQNEDFLKRMFEALMRYQKLYLSDYPNNLWEFASVFWDKDQKLEEYKGKLIHAGNDEWELQNLVPQILLPDFRNKIVEELFPKFLRKDMDTYKEGVWHAALNKLDYDNLEKQGEYVLKAYSSLMSSPEYVSYQFTQKLLSAFTELRESRKNIAWRDLVDVAFSSFCSFRNIPAKVFEIGKKIEQRHQSNIELQFKGLLEREKVNFESIFHGVQDIIDLGNKRMATFDQPGTRTYEDGEFIANLLGLEHIIIGTLVGNLFQHPASHSDKKKIEIGCDFNDDRNALLIWYLDNSEGFNDEKSFRKKLGEEIKSGEFDKLPGIINFCLVHGANLSVYVKTNNSDIELRPIIGNLPDIDFKVRRNSCYNYGIIVRIPRTKDY